MGHNIEHFVVEDTKKARQQFLEELRERVEHETWEEGGGYGGPRSLLNDSHWHRGHVYATREEAERAIESMDNRWYDDHAVLFHDVDSLSDTKVIQDQRQRIATLRQKRAGYHDANLPTTRKSQYLTCPQCGSKVNRDYLTGRGYRCPVCHGHDAFMSETVRKSLARYDERIAEAEGRLRDMKRQRAEQAPVRWLAKAEWHT